MMSTEISKEGRKAGPKTYGRLTFHDVGRNGAWTIKADPHVMIRLKNFFPRIKKTEFGTAGLQNNDEVCREIEWFMVRYPFEMDMRAQMALSGGSRRYQNLQLELEKVLTTEFTPREFIMAKPLRDYQARSVEVYLRAGALLVADQLGLGKSVTAIGSLTVPGTLPALVVCQTHLTRQWQRYFAMFVPGMKTHIIKTGINYALPKCEVYIISYHKLAAWADQFIHDCFKSIIFDEIQELRHSGTRKWDSAKAIRESCQYAMGLSATPIYNYGGEMFNVMEVLKPGALGDYYEFSREWCDWDNKKSIIKDPVAFGCYLRENFLMLRHTRAEVGMELPEMERIMQEIPYSVQALDEIKNVATELAHIILKGSFTERGEAAREFDIKLRQATGIAKAAYVAEYVKMLIEEGEPVLLFGWHRAVYDVWLERLKEFNPVFYTGTESPKKKDDNLQIFARGESKVMIMSLRAGSGTDGFQVGCNTCVFGELDWSPGVHEQCIGRLNRDGVKAGVRSFFLVADGGSDPAVAEVLGLKTAQVKGMVDPQSRENPIAGQTDMGRVKRMAQEYLNRHKGDKEYNELPTPIPKSPASYVMADGKSLSVIEGATPARDPDMLSPVI